MKKLSITTVASVAVNIILSLWLVNQYSYDQYFRAYVDASLGPVYPFIVLTAGLGGGSSLGYLLLRKRRVGDATGRLGKAKLFKSTGPTPTQGSLSSSQGKVLPTGPPPGQVSRHTAYAVPPLPKGSTSSGSTRGIPSSISASAKTITPIPSSFQRDQLAQPSTSILGSSLRGQFGTDQTSRTSPAISSTAGTMRGEMGQPMNRIPPESSRTNVPQWKTEPGALGSRGPDSTVFPRPVQTELKPRVEPTSFGSPVGQVPRPPQPSQTPFPVSKWVSPEQRGEGQWTDPVPKPGLAAPQRWAPPAGSGFGSRPQQPGPQRPGAGPAPGGTGPRPPYPPAQCGPRPLGFPSPLRPGPAPIGAPPGFRSDQPRPAGSPPPRPPQASGGPVSQPWNPPKPGERGESLGGVQDKDTTGPPSPRPSQYGVADAPRSSDSRASDAGSSGGEMDWDTALDTILKTLKKDRGVGEKP